jgi:hypothetical protein
MGCHPAAEKAARTSRIQSKQCSRITGLPGATLRTSLPTAENL